MQSTRLCTILLTYFFFSATTSAQVFDSGPSDAALFANVINVPGDVVPTSVVSGTQVNVTNGGSLGDDFGAFSGSEVNISGGFVGDAFFAGSGSEININGGSVGDAFLVIFDGEVNISGGSVGTGFAALQGSEVNISGGSVGEGFTAISGSNVNLFGSGFALDGVLLDNLIFGEAFTIFDREVSLSGLLADGSEFSFNLNSDETGFQDAFEPNSVLTVTLTSVPEPGSMVMLLLVCGFVGMRRMRSTA